MERVAKGPEVLAASDKNRRDRRDRRSRRKSCRGKSEQHLPKSRICIVRRTVLFRLSLSYDRSATDGLVRLSPAEAEIEN